MSDETKAHEALNGKDYQLQRVEWSADSLTATLKGELPQSEGGTSGAFSLLLHGVRESRLLLGSRMPVVRPVIAAEHPLLWNYGPCSTIFGNASLPDPPRFFQEFYQSVVCDLGLARDPARYLNWDRSLREWFDFVYSRTYRLLTGPDPVVEAAKLLLDVQAAEYMVLPEPPQPDLVRPNYAVVFGESWVICDSVELKI